MLIGIDVFLGTSVLTCILDKHFSDKLTYLYQLLGLAGFGQLLVTNRFIDYFPDSMRFWYSFIYLGIALGNVMLLNGYLYFYKRKDTVAKFFLAIGTAPSIIASTLFLNGYASEAPYSIIPLPSLPLELMFLSVLTVDTLLIGLGLYAMVKPEWWKITGFMSTIIAGGAIFTYMKPVLGETAFIAGTIYIYIILGFACIVVLGASLYALSNLLREKKGKGVI